MPGKAWAAAASVNTVSVSGSVEGGSNVVKVTVTLDGTIETEGPIDVKVKGSATDSEEKIIKILKGTSSTTETYDLDVGLSMIGGSSVAAGTYTVTADGSAASLTGTPSTEVTVLAPNVTLPAQGGTYSFSPEKGLSGNTYTGKYNPASGYHFTKWADGETSNPRSGMLFGTTYAAEAEADVTPDPTDFNIVGTTTITGGEESSFTVSATPLEYFDPAKLTYEVGGFVNCSSDIKSGSNATAKVTLNNVKGNGTFFLTVKYKGTVKKKVPITVKTTITDAEIYGESSIVLGESEDYLYTLSPTAAEGTETKWTLSTGATTYVTYTFDKSTGILTLKGKKLTPSASPITLKLYSVIGGTETFLKSLQISVVNEPEIIDEIEISGPSELAVGDSATYTGIAKCNGKPASNSKVTWEVDNETIASITSAGKLTIKNTASAGEVITITATSVADPTVSETFDVDVVDIALIMKVMDITQGYSLNLALGGNISTSPSSASSTIKSITWVSDAESVLKPATDNKSAKGMAEGSANLTATIEFKDGTTGTAGPYEIDVYPTATIDSYATDEAITVTMPDKAISSYNGSGTTSNIDNVDACVISICNTDGKILYTDSNNLVKLNTDGTVTISESRLNESIARASANISSSKDQTSLKFLISPANKSSGKYNINAGALSESKTAYRVLVHGKPISESGSSSTSASDVVTKSFYGFVDNNIPITIDDTDKYVFDHWKDNTSANRERSVKISSTTSNNEYIAYMKLKSSSSSSSSSGSGSGSNTSNKATNSNLDKVPKTGETMTIYWLVIIAVISGSIAASILYQNYAPKVKSWRGGDEGSGDNFQNKK